jgi:hypothetical protein
MRRRADWFVMVAAAAALAASCNGRIQWADAYTALGAGEHVRSARDRDADPVRLANADAENELPRGFTPGPRIHPPGTLAHLRYQTFDSTGASLESWEVRALVPPLPAIEGHGNQERPLVETTPCSGACGDRGRTGLVMVHSGQPGLSAEWVLRMPVGRTFDLGPRTLITQDLLGAARRVSLTSRRDGDRYVTEPANIQVTLHAVCAAKVRLGSFTRFELDPNAIVPFPRGWRTYRWVQLDDCGRIAPLAETAPVAPPQPRVARTVPESAGDTSHAILTVRREPGQGFVQLLVDEAWLQREGIPRTIRLEARCRYDPAANAWEPVSATGPSGSLRVMVRPPDEAGRPPRVLSLLPREPGLFWVQWIEGLRDTSGGEMRSGRDAAFRRHEAFVPSGPILCNDLEIGAPPAGTVVACVPFADRAQAQFVPKPDSSCAR